MAHTPPAVKESLTTEKPAPSAEEMLEWFDEFGIAVFTELEDPDNDAAFGEQGYEDVCAEDDMVEVCDLMYLSGDVEKTIRAATLKAAIRAAMEGDND